MTKWGLVPAEQFYELMFRLDELERNGALPYQLEGMAAAIEFAPQPEPLSDERIFDLLKQVDTHAVRLPLGFKQFAIAIEREILGEIKK